MPLWHNRHNGHADSYTWQITGSYGASQEQLDSTGYTASASCHLMSHRLTQSTCALLHADAGNACAELTNSLLGSLLPRAGGSCLHMWFTDGCTTLASSPRASSPACSARLGSVSSTSQTYPRRWRIWYQPDHWWLYTVESTVRVQSARRTKAWQQMHLHTKPSTSRGCTPTPSRAKPTPQPSAVAAQRNETNCPVARAPACGAVQCSAPHSADVPGWSDEAGRRVALAQRLASSARARDPRRRVARTLALSPQRLDAERLKLTPQR